MDKYFINKKTLELSSKLKIVDDYKNINQAKKQLEDLAKNSAILSEICFSEEEGTIGIRMRDLPRSTREKLCKTIVDIINEEHYIILNNTFKSLNIK